MRVPEMNNVTVMKQRGNSVSLSIEALSFVNKNIL